MLVRSVCGPVHPQSYCQEAEISSKMVNEKAYDSIIYNITPTADTYIVARAYTARA